MLFLLLSQYVGDKYAKAYYFYIFIFRRDNMKQIKYLLSILVMALFISNSALASVHGEMQSMNRHVNALAKANNAEELQKSAQAIRETATQAMAKKPSSVKDDETYAGYQKGMQHFIDVVTQVEDLAKQGKFDEAKELSKQLQELKVKYHKLYK
ncbi:MAG TPA: cytochrome b562 [Pasteurellaceae bacterium]|nr:cytochrome b562 [Pasteurellaceae bacterium]